MLSACAGKTFSDFIPAITGSAGAAAGATICGPACAAAGALVATAGTEAAIPPTEPISTDPKIAGKQLFWMFVEDFWHWLLGAFVVLTILPSPIQMFVKRKLDGDPNT